MSDSEDLSTLQMQSLRYLLDPIGSERIESKNKVRLQYGYLKKEVPQFDPSDG
jgi:hypothetical protein